LLDVVELAIADEGIDENDPDPSDETMDEGLDLAAVAGQTL
jgi:hypothetical protein